MKLVSLLGLCGAIALVTVGCGDDGRTTTDSGIVLMDSGTGPADTGTPPADSGTPPTDGGGGACPPQQFPPPTTTPCATATATCAMSAASQAELEACIAADPMAMACGDCLNEASTSCVTMNGCDDEFGAIFCCADDNGCAGDDLPCVETNCATEIDAFRGCGNAVGAACSVGPVFATCTPAG